MKKNFCRFLAAVLAMMMVMGSVSVTNAGDPEPGPVVETRPIKVVNGVATPSDVLDGSNTLEGDLNIGQLSYHDKAALYVNAVGEGKISTATIEGNVSIASKLTWGSGGEPYAVRVEADEGSSAEVNIQGTITSTGKGEYTWAYGIYANAGEGSTVTVNAGKSVIASSTWSLGGDKEYAYGVRIYPKSGNTEINVGGDVTAEASGKAYALRVVNSGPASGSISLAVKGKAVAKAESETGYAYAAYMLLSEGDAAVTVGQGAEGDIHLQAQKGSTFAFQVDENGVQGDVDLIAKSQSTVTLDVKGSVTGQTKLTADNGTASIHVVNGNTGAMTLQGANQGTASGSISGDINGNVTLKSYDNNQGGTASLTAGCVKGNVTLDSMYQGSSTLLVKNGDVTGETTITANTGTASINVENGNTGTMTLQVANQGTASGSVSGDINGNVKLKSYDDNHQGGTANLTAGSIAGDVVLNADYQGTVTLDVKEGGVGGLAWVNAYGQSTANVVIDNM